MNHARRRKKRPSYGVRSVELARGKNGFGFTISGQAPCIFSCIVAGSPAESAGLRPGDFLIAANGLNISRLPHDDVVRLIGNSTGLLRLQIAENYYSDSSSDDESFGKTKHANRSRHRHVYRAEKVVRDLWTGALFEDRTLSGETQEAPQFKPKDAGVSGSCERHKKLVPQCKQPVLRAVVGYLGTIEMPPSSFRLGAINNCIRRLRIEKKVHTLVLLSVFSDGILLTDPRGLALANFPADRIAFSGAYADDRKFFGLVTCHNSESVGKSCHVFLVDPKLRPHRGHARQSKAFHLTCTPHRHLPDECKEFPESADVLLKVVAGLYGNRADSLASPQPSNASSNSSNSDSGIGFKDEGNNSDRVVIVDVESYHRYRTNSLDRQSLSLPILQRDRLTCRTMPDPIGLHPTMDKLSPKVFQGSPHSFTHLQEKDENMQSFCRVEEAAEKWARTASLRRHLPGRKRSVRKSISDVTGTVSDGELPDSSASGQENGMDVKRVGSLAGRFDLFLEDPAGLHAFTDFLKQEFSQENILFWTACENFRKLTDEDEMSRKAKEIYDRHLCAGAADPVNVDSMARQVAQEGLDQPTIDIFLPAQKQIFNLMKFDCYQRFLKSRLFKGCLLREMQGPEEGCHKHKSLLPWGRSKSKLKRRKKRTESDGSDSSARINSVESLSCPEIGSFCRVILPDLSTAVLRLNPEESIGDMLQSLLQRRGLTYTAIEAFRAGTHKPLEPHGNASSLLCRQIRLERRILFRLNLPSGLGVLGVKAPPDRSCRETLNPVLLRFGLQLDHYVLHLPSCNRLIELSHPISAVDGITLTLCTQQELHGLTYSTPDIDNGTSDLFRRLASGEAHFYVSDVAILHLQQPEEKEKGEEQNPEDLLDIWKRAQRSRLDDQRGTEINFELPDFLKVRSGKENRPVGPRPPPPLPPKSKGRPPPRPPSRKPFCISFV